MKLIIFGIVILLSLQGCSSYDKFDQLRVIKSCHYVYPDYRKNEKNEKQCKKDKKILTEVLGEGGLDAENMRRNLIGDFAFSSGFIIPPVLAAAIIISL